MKLLVLAAVVGAVLAVGLYSTSASADGGGVTTTLGDESNPMVASNGPLLNAVNHLCPDGQMLTTGHLSKDDPLLNLCKAMGAHLSTLKLAATSPLTGIAAPPPDECRKPEQTGTFD